MLIMFTIWAVCLLLNIFIGLKGMAIDTVKSKKISDLTYKDIYDQLSKSKEATSFFFTIVLTPIGTIIGSICIGMEFIKNWVKRMVIGN